MATPSVGGKFLWHELMTTDPAAAKKFYGGVVGWKTKAFEQDPSYQMWMMGDRAMGGLMPQRLEGGTGPKPQWFNYIGTPDADATVKQAVELGGKVMRPAWDIPNVGRIGFLNDPQGAVFAILQPLPMQGEMPGPQEMGNFSWHELLSTNWQAAWEFYSKLFGWQKTDSMDMGPMGTYQMFGQDGKTYGGMYTKSTTPPGPPFWLAYANVPDSKRAAETIKKLGGTIMNGPMEVPGGGVIVTAVDPQGAAFSVFSKAPAKPAPTKPAATKPATAAKSASAAPKKAAAKKVAPAKARPKKKAAKARAKSRGASARKRSGARRAKPAARKRSRNSARKRR
jgi:predicted enzyme related to lactoylglutathione lyase